jgi:hypothetical protein
MYSQASVMLGNSRDSTAHVIGFFEVMILGIAISRRYCEKRKREAWGPYLI